MLGFGGSSVELAACLAAASASSFSFMATWHEYQQKEKKREREKSWLVIFAILTARESACVCRASLMGNAKRLYEPVKTIYK